MFVSILRILVFEETWILNWVCVVLEILDFEFWIEYVLNWRFWTLVLVAANEFWHQLNFCIGQQLFDAVIFLKKLAHTSAVPSTTVLVCANFSSIFAPSVPFFNAVSEEPRWYVILSIAVVQPCLYLQYFLSRLNPSRLSNRACKPYTTTIKCFFSTSVRRCESRMINKKDNKY